jgi:hypothetical protein
MLLLCRQCLLLPAWQMLPMVYFLQLLQQQYTLAVQQHVGVNHHRQH